MPSITDRIDIQMKVKRFITIETIADTIPMMAPAGPNRQPNMPNAMIPKIAIAASVVRFTLPVNPHKPRSGTSPEEMQAMTDIASAMIDTTSGATGFFAGRVPGILVCWTDIILSPVCLIPYRIIQYLGPNTH